MKLIKNIHAGYYFKAASFFSRVSFLVSLSLALGLVSCANPLGSNSFSQAGFLSKPLSFTDNSSSLFNAGSSVGTVWDSTGSFLRLDQSASANYSGLDSSWTPHWSNVVAYWPLDNSWTETITNTAGVLTPSGGPNPVFTSASKIGNSAGSFSGTTNHSLNLPAASAVNYSNLNGLNFGTSDFTISLWIQTSVSNQYMGILARNSQCGASASLFDLGTNSNGQIHMAMGQDNLGTNNSDTSTASVVTDGKWHQVVFTRSGTSQIFYVDGIVNNTATTVGIANISSNAVVTMGWDDCESMDFNGLLDDIAVWSGYALNLTDVQTIYGRQLAKYSGTFTSRTMDALSSTSWINFSWQSTLPFFKELPDYTGGIQNELASNYPSQSATLMSGIIGLWHFDENVGAGAVFDRSGQGESGTPTNITFGVPGKLGTAANFGGSSLITTTSAVDINTLSQLTLSAWFNPTAAATSNGGVFVGYTYTAGWGATYIGLTSSGINFRFGSGSPSQNYTYPSSFNLNTWYHVVAVHNYPGDDRLYINGSLVYTSPGASAPLANNSTSMYFGENVEGSPGDHFQGYLDEVAIWRRGLSASEVLELYRRGANRIKYQMRSCSDSACATNPSWLGPDGTNQTYFSELNNNAIPVDGGDLNTADLVQILFPTMVFSTFTSLSIPRNRYFQYRAIMESDDTGTANCNYISPQNAGNTWCSPELQSMTVNSLF